MFSQIPFGVEPDFGARSRFRAFSQAILSSYFLCVCRAMARDLEFINLNTARCPVESILRICVAGIPIYSA
jgi:hypothetical protein